MLMQSHSDDSLVHRTVPHACALAHARPTICHALVSTVKRAAHFHPAWRIEPSSYLTHRNLGSISGNNCVAGGNSLSEGLVLVLGKVAMNSINPRASHIN